MSQDDLERELNSLRPGGPDGRLDRALLPEARAVDGGETVDAGNGRGLWTWTAVAATALIAVGLGWRQWNAGKNPNDANGGTTQVTETKGFYVHVADEARKQVMAQEFDDFAVSVYRPGDTLGDGVLENVRADEIELRSPAGQRWLDVQANNAGVLTALRAEVGAMSALGASRLTDSQLARLGDIAGLGVKEAAALLETASQNGGAAQESAKAALSGSYARKQLLLSWDYARRDGAVGTRLKAIRTLGQAQSPLSAQLLTSLAAETNDARLGKACVEELARFSAKWSAPGLDALSRSAGQEDVRVAAQAALTLLSKEMANDEN